MKVNLLKNILVYILLLGCLALISPTEAQQDSLKTYDLQPAITIAQKLENTVKSLNKVHQTFIIGGRKSEVISLKELPGNIAEKTGRQIFAKIPSAFVYDMDGSGNQVNLSVRGLDAHRSWEFNVRQNGVLINTDIYGYPASHYSMPMEAVERIEMVRGTGALQFGQQFGGLLNYVLKGPDSTRTFAFENITTVGSFGLLSSFNSIGGKVGKLSYYAYYQKRVSNGYRDHARSESDAQHGQISYEFNTTLKLTAQVSRSYYMYRIPGPLTDGMFEENPRQATRLRNFYSPDMVIPSLTLDWKISPNTTLEWILSGGFGQRNSLIYDTFANVPDLILPETKDFAPRNVDIDNYRSRTSEARLLHEYLLRGKKHQLNISTRYFNNFFQRRQRGMNTTGFDYNLSIKGDFARNIFLHSESIAVAVENQFNLTNKFSVSPGFRYEHGQSDMTGQINYLEASDVPRSIPYRFAAMGVHTNYEINHFSRIYGGISQANRPVLFADIIPGSPLATIAQDLEHAFGYNAELGWENFLTDRWKYNLTYFRTYMGNRIGNVLMEENGQTKVAKSNTGNSMTDGVELYLEGEIFRSENWLLSAYTASSYMNGRYISGEVASGNQNMDITGNRIESVPRWISRNGLSASYQKVKMVFQHQYVSETFADAINTESPPATGSVGLVPEYHIWDVNLVVPFGQKYIFRAGVNNVFNKQYFTKRPQMYPGPGIWPSDGRGVVISLNMKIY
ncbi:TonB-dependent receptor family protein [Aquiflexum sp.]|uniref:TonB-dependent receptor family protein n=1 Tax=Aquiflexum sp. TaxID=1872584 RepID=UPI0035930BBC